MGNLDIIYINGIHTKYSEGCSQADAIEKFTGKHVFLFHNPSATWTTSLIESLWNRWFHWIRPAPIVRRLASYIERSIGNKPHGYSYMLAHSQGTAILNNAVNLLPDEIKARIRMTLFAPVNSFSVSGVDRVERFLNKQDYVVSKLFGIAKGGGFTYLRSGKGHSFIKSYLNKISEFGGYESSMFWSLRKEA